MDILKAINLYEQTEEDEMTDQLMFNRMVNFLLSLEHDKLSIEQLDKLIEIVNQIEFLGGDLEEARRAKKSKATIKQYARNYYRKNKLTLQKRKRKISNSADGKKRARNKKRMAKANKTPSGRNKIIYNTIGHVNT